MTTWQRQEEDLFFKCARACYGTKYFDFESIFDSGILSVCDVIGKVNVRNRCKMKQFITLFNLIGCCFLKLCYKHV